MKLTNLNGSNTETTGLKEKTNATCSDSLPKSTHHSSCHQNVLHFLQPKPSKTENKGISLLKEEQSLLLCMTQTLPSSESKWPFLGFFARRRLISLLYDLRDPLPPYLKPTKNKVRIFFFNF